MITSPSTERLFRDLSGIVLIRKQIIHINKLVMIVISLSGICFKIILLLSLVIKTI